jgi:hypothetical protein
VHFDRHFISGEFARRESWKTKTKKATTHKHTIIPSSKAASNRFLLGNKNTPKINSEERENDRNQESSGGTVHPPVKNI